jgi:hypothetical protein
MVRAEEIERQAAGAPKTGANGSCRIGTPRYASVPPTPHNTIVLPELV